MRSPWNAQHHEDLKCMREEIEISGNEFIRLQLPISILLSNLANINH
jgi:hypothetical protein